MEARSLENDMPRAWRFPRFAVSSCFTEASPGVVAASEAFAVIGKFNWPFLGVAAGRAFTDFRFVVFFVLLLRFLGELTTLEMTSPSSEFPVPLSAAASSPFLC